jgi:hypothetical protein
MVIGATVVGILYSVVPDLPLAKTNSLPGERELAIFGAVIIFMFLTSKTVQLQEEEI